VEPDCTALSASYIQSELLMSVWWPQVAEAAASRGWRSDVAFLDRKSKRIAVSFEEAE